MASYSNLHGRISTLQMFASDIRLITVGSLQFYENRSGSRLPSLRTVCTSAIYSAGILVCTIRMLLNLLRAELFKMRYLIKPIIVFFAYNVYKTLSVIDSSIKTYGVSDRGLETLYSNMPYLFCYLLCAVSMTIYYVLIDTSDVCFPRTLTFDWNDMTWIYTPVCGLVTNHGSGGTVDNMLSAGQPGTADIARVCNTRQGDGPQGFRVPTGNPLSKYYSALKIVSKFTSLYSALDCTARFIDYMILCYIKWFSDTITSDFHTSHNQQNISINEIRDEANQSHLIHTSPYIVTISESDDAAEGYLTPDGTERTHSNPFTTDSNHVVIEMQDQSDP